MRPDAVMGTGRSDYPNQINNVLCFPFIFRGALDCGATTINEEMKLAAVRAIAALAHAEIPEVVAQAYGAVGLRFGRDYLIPKPFDPRLIEVVAPAVAKAAADSGVAHAADRRHRELPRAAEPLRLPVRAARCSRCSPRPSATRRPWSTPRARTSACCGRHRWSVDEGMARPLLLGRPDVMAGRIAEFGLRLKPGEDCALRRTRTTRPSTATRPTNTTACAGATA